MRWADVRCVLTLNSARGSGPGRELKSNAPPGRRCRRHGRRSGITESVPSLTDPPVLWSDPSSLAPCRVQRILQIFLRIYLCFSFAVAHPTAKSWGSGRPTGVERRSSAPVALLFPQLPPARVIWECSTLALSNVIRRLSERGVGGVCTFGDSL